MENEYPSPGKGFNVAVAIVALVAVVAGAVILVAGGLSAENRTRLETTHDQLLQVDRRQGPLPTPDAVEAGKAYQRELDSLRAAVDDFYASRDRNLEKYFEEYDTRRGGDFYRRIYREKADALYERARPVLVKDTNGNPAPADEVYQFEPFDFVPPSEAVRLAQMKFNVQEAVTDIFLQMLEDAQAAREGGGKRLDPVLLSVLVDNPPELKAGQIAGTVPARIEALLDARDVAVLLGELLGPGGHGLLVKLAGLKVEKVGSLETTYKETVKEGEEPAIQPEDFLKPVRVTVQFEVVDYQAAAQSG